MSQTTVTDSPTPHAVATTSVATPRRRLLTRPSTVERARTTSPSKPAPLRRRHERGQGTVEYALVLLAAAALALVVVAWVSRTDTIGRLFDTVLNSILGRAA